jgi:hypothetical protein
VIEWSKEAIGARVDQLARDHEGEEFIEAVRVFGEEQLDERERRLLHDVLMERATRGRIGLAARHRREDSWTRRMMDGRFGRKRPGSPR